jgi:hypothetical protein
MSHNPNSQQKEAHLYLYNQKEPFKFVKYLIMGQALHSGVGGMPRSLISQIKIPPVLFTHIG